MQFFYPFLLYLRSAFVSLLFGKNRNLPEIVRLEEGFFHDLKGLYNKRLGLPINKFESGNYDERIIEDIRLGAEDVVKRFREVRQQFFELFATDWELVGLYREVRRLEKSLEHSDPAATIQVLRRIQERAFAFYKSRITKSLFDLRDLLNQVVANHKISGIAASFPVHLKYAVSDDRSTFRLPYSDYGTWRRILDNVIINAIEAIEQTGRGGAVSIRLDYAGKGKARITIADDGVGMDEKTLRDFAKRGFTSGKVHGQGLGISEDVIAFVDQRGRFDVESKLGQGTTVKIDIEINKIVGAQADKPLLSGGSKRIVAVVIIVLAILVVSYISGITLLHESQPIYSLDRWDPDSATSFKTYHGITAYDHLGKIIWQKTFRPYLVDDDSPEAQCRPILLDVDNDGRMEVILARRRSGSDFPGDGNILCLNERGDSVWGVEVGLKTKRPIFDYDSAGQEGWYGLKTIKQLPSTTGEPVQILVIAIAHNFPTQILILDGRGFKLNEYWHTGHLRLQETEQFDYDGNGTKDLVFSGCNNRMGWATVLIITERSKLSGQSPPWIDSQFPRAKEGFYFLFGHAWLNDSIGFKTDFNNDTAVTSYCIAINGFSNPRCNNPYASDMGNIDFEDGRSVRLDHKLGISVTIDSSEFDMWWSLRRAVDFVGRNWTKSDLKELRGYRKYVDGELVEDSITINSIRYDHKRYWARKLQGK